LVFSGYQLERKDQKDEVRKLFNEAILNADGTAPVSNPDGLSLADISRNAWIKKVGDDVEPGSLNDDRCSKINHLKMHWTRRLHRHKFRNRFSRAPIEPASNG